VELKRSERAFLISLRQLDLQALEASFSCEKVSDILRERIYALEKMYPLSKICDILLAARSERIYVHFEVRDLLLEAVVDAQVE
jgi:hypothetical protein